MSEAGTTADTVEGTTDGGAGAANVGADSLGGGAQDGGSSNIGRGAELQAGLQITVWVPLNDWS